MTSPIHQVTQYLTEARANEAAQLKHAEKQGLISLSADDIEVLSNRRWKIDAYDEALDMMQLVDTVPALRKVHEGLRQQLLSVMRQMCGSDDEPVIYWKALAKIEEKMSVALTSHDSQN